MSKNLLWMSTRNIKDSVKRIKKSLNKSFQLKRSKLLLEEDQCLNNLHRSSLHLTVNKTTMDSNSNNNKIIIIYKTYNNNNNSHNKGKPPTIKVVINLILICPLPLLQTITTIQIQYLHPLDNHSTWDSTCKEVLTQHQYRISLATFKTQFHLYPHKEGQQHKWLLTTQIVLESTSMILVKLQHLWAQARCHLPWLETELKASPQLRSKKMTPNHGYPHNHCNKSKTTELWIKIKLTWVYIIVYHIN